MEFGQGQGSSTGQSGIPVSSACVSTRPRRTACIATRLAAELKVVTSAATCTSGFWRSRCRVQALSLPLLQDRRTFLKPQLPILRRIADELQSGFVDAVPQMRRLRAVLEHVSQMRIAKLAGYFHPLHKHAHVFMRMNILLGNGSEETRPTGARIEF